MAAPAAPAGPAEASAKAQARAEEDEENHSLARSDDTVWEAAEGANEDDLVETTVGQSKNDSLFARLEHFVAKRFGAKGSTSRPKVPVEALAKHRSEEDFWCVIDGKVFDLGPFLRGEAKHPGGKSILTRQLSLGGQDAAERFVRWHNPSGNTVRRAPDFFVGDLDGELPSETKRCSCSIA